MILILNSTCSLLDQGKQLTFYNGLISCNLVIITYQFQELFSQIHQDFIQTVMSSADKHSLMSSFPICVHLLPLTASSKNFQYNIEKIVNPSVVLHRVLKNQSTSTLYTCFQVWQFFKHPRPIFYYRPCGSVAASVMSCS